MLGLILYFLTDINMPLDKSHMITDKDVKFHPPLSFPGKKNINNKNGTFIINNL